MKRQNEPDPLSQGEHKRAKKEYGIFCKVVFEETGATFDGLTTLQRSTIPSLRRICHQFNLDVAKSGGVRTPTSTKRDYINAVMRYASSMDMKNDPGNAVEMEVDNAEPSTIRSIPSSSYSHKASITVRLYDRGWDYGTEYRAQALIRYDITTGIFLGDLKTAFGLKRIAVIHPRSYRPMLDLHDGCIDSCLLASLLGTHKYLRVTGV